MSIDKNEFIQVKKIKMGHIKTQSSLPSVSATVHKECMLCQGLQANSWLAGQWDAWTHKPSFCPFPPLSLLM